MSTEVLSRIQFALTISFHFLFPPMGIGILHLSRQGGGYGRVLLSGLPRISVESQGRTPPAATRQAHHWPELDVAKAADRITPGSQMISFRYSHDSRWHSTLVFICSQLSC